jgi:hypothetical protein
MTEYPAPWWFKLANRFFPDRCREIPEAQNPDRIVLRQVALVKRYVYLQQFASAEDRRWQHSHQWRRTFAIGLFGSYYEERGHLWRVRRAPYFYTMDASVTHRVEAPSNGHTSLFVGLWRDDDLKHYFPAPAVGVRRWEDHIQKMVKRI